MAKGKEKSRTIPENVGREKSCSKDFYIFHVVKLTDNQLAITGDVWGEGKRLNFRNDAFERTHEEYKWRYTDGR